MADQSQVDWTHTDGAHKRVMDVLDAIEKPMTIDEVAAEANVSPYTARHIVTDVVDCLSVSEERRGGLHICYRSALDEALQDAVALADSAQTVSEDEARDDPVAALASTIQSLRDED